MGDCGSMVPYRKWPRWLMAANRMNDTLGLQSQGIAPHCGSAPDAAVNRETPSPPMSSWRLPPMVWRQRDRSEPGEDFRVVALEVAAYPRIADQARNLARMIRTGGRARGRAPLVSPASISSSVGRRLRRASTSRAAANSCGSTIAGNTRRRGSTSPAASAGAASRACRSGAQRHCCRYISHW
jgi:hypothetical protein